MTLMVLSVTGSDQPGLTQALAAAVLTAGGNWLESHLSRLGGLFVGSVLVDIAPEKTDRLRAVVAAVDARGLEVRIAPAVATPDAGGEALQLTLVGQDRPGIVSQVTDVLRRLDANIERFETRLGQEPYSGAPLFHMDAQVRLPPALSRPDLQGALEAISAEVMVDISLAPAA
jgi:glycine cleavage system regulatory protein